MYHAYLLVALLLAARQNTKATISNGANQHLFLELCETYNWAENGIEALLQTAEGTNAFDDILKINMSLSSSTWRKHFKKADNEDKYHETPTSEHKGDTMATDLWTHWVEIVKQMKTDDQVTAAQKDASLHDVTSGTRTAATALINKLSLKAYLVNKQLAALPDKPATDAVKEAENKIRAAVYGATSKPGGGGLKPTNLATPGPNNRRTLCTAATAADSKFHLAWIGICLCTRGGDTTGSAVAEPCRHLTGTGTAWPTSDPAVLTAYNNLLKQCKTTTKAKVSAAVIEAKYEKLRNSFNFQTAKGVLGAYITTGCNGEDNGGVCVEYTDVTDASSEKVESILWLAQLKAAADSLLKAERYSAAAKPLLRSLEIIKHEVMMAHRIADPQQTTHTDSVNTSSGNHKSEEDGKCHQHSKSKSTCENTSKCKWEGKT
uniref:Variant surface glycoprotein 1125.4893 n=1 Tax=Trypanosoma brucei TaxID=5691 RepID=A0A1J0RBL9_9TRYP|nr:variant surface glycoprotein 1125.4893 [Trypanosoma brucei]